MNHSLHQTLFAAVLSTAWCPAQHIPELVSLEPRHQAVGLDPWQVSKLVVTFDRDMDPMHHALCGGGPSFPKVIRVQWRDPRTFVADVELQADQVYVLDLACPSSGGFKAADGTRLPPTAWRFATAGQRLAAGEAAAATTRLFAAITDHYSYRDRLGVDWAQLERDHHDALVGSLDGPALALRIAEVLATAQDPHITVRWRETVLSTYQRAVVANFDARGLAPHFPKLQRVGRIGLHGRSDDGIGYLMVSTFARDQREDFDLVVDTLRHLRDCKALVLDVRQNGGGDELLARRLAAFFVRGDKVYAAHRVRDPKAPEGFRDREDREIRGNQDPETFAGPVAVLMGPANMSSCEAFLLMMKQAPQVVLVGADSFGSSGNPQPHTLVAGLSVLLPSWQAMRPDGSVIEGEGIAPHIHVAADADQLATADPVVGEALLRLRGQR